MSSLLKNLLRYTVALALLASLSACVSLGLSL